MADVYTRIGYIKGATGAHGAQGAKGDTGDAATIQVGSVTTVPYGQTANVVNSGTEQAAVFDFTIPQGRPGQQTTEMDNLLLNSITTSAAEFPIPAVGETGKVLWGKVTKWFSDMTALVATKLNAANVVNNLTTTTSGYALDARQGKVLYDAIGIESYTIPSSSINSKLSVQIARINKTGRVCELQLQATATANISAWDALITSLHAAYIPYSVVQNTETANIGGVPYVANINMDGLVNTAGAISNWARVFIKMMYISGVSL